MQKEKNSSGGEFGYFLAILVPPFTENSNNIRPVICSRFATLLSRISKYGTVVDTRISGHVLLAPTEPRLNCQDAKTPRPNPAPQGPHRPTPTTYSVLHLASCRSDATIRQIYIVRMVSINKSLILQGYPDNMTHLGIGKVSY